MAHKYNCKICLNILIILNCILPKNFLVSDKVKSPTHSGSNGEERHFSLSPLLPSPGAQPRCRFCWDMKCSQFYQQMPVALGRLAFPALLSLNGEGKEATLQSSFLLLALWKQHLKEAGLGDRDWKREECKPMNGMLTGDGGEKLLGPVMLRVKHGPVLYRS